MLLTRGPIKNTLDDYNFLFQKDNSFPSKTSALAILENLLC